MHLIGVENLSCGHVYGKARQVRANKSTPLAGMPLCAVLRKRFEALDTLMICPPSLRKRALSQRQHHGRRPCSWRLSCDLRVCVH